MFHFTPYAIPALLTLLSKACIFLYARYSRVHNLNTTLFLLFLFCLSIQNLAEIAFFSAKSAGLSSPPSGKLYFGASIFAVALFLHLAVVLGTNKGKGEKQAPAMIILLYGPALVLQVLLWASPSLVAGFAPLGYTYTKIPGPLYFLFELYTLAYLSGSAALFAYGAYAQTTSFRRSQNKLLLAGLLPAVVLVVVIVVLQRFGFTGFNTTTTLPVAVTFFLAVTAYATHQYRLFDIDFFIPWSKVRKRKTEFYKRIQATIGAIAELRSVREIAQLIANTLQCQLALVGGPQSIAALAKGQDKTMNLLPLSRFPLDQLKKVEHIVVAQEIADRDPALYRAMETYRVGAIVPFRSHNRRAAHWLILGDHFSYEVYTPLDFKAVERLFAAMAERFLEDFLQVRSQFDRIQEQLARTRLELGLSWHKEDEAKRALRAIRAENRELREEVARLQNDTLKLKLDETSAKAEVTLEEYLSTCERDVVLSALARFGGNRLDAAVALGVTPRTIEYLMKRHRIVDDDLPPQ